MISRLEVTLDHRAGVAGRDDRSELGLGSCFFVVVLVLQILGADLVRLGAVDVPEHAGRDRRGAGGAVADDAERALVSPLFLMLVSDDDTGQPELFWLHDFTLSS